MNIYHKKGPLYKSKEPLYINIIVFTTIDQLSEH